MSDNLMLGRDVEDDEVGRLDLVPIRRPARITFRTQELQALCPAVAGIQPDIYDATICFDANTHFIESKSLKLWLTTYREQRIFAEDLAVAIQQRLEQYAPLIGNVGVRLVQNIRGGIVETVEVGL